MSTWGTITLDMMDEADVKVSKKVPAGLMIDNGVDERCWLEEDERYFALSNGRYQHLRFLEQAKDFHSPWYNGVRRVAVVDAEDTGDTATVYVLRPLQDKFEARQDGFRVVDEYEGGRWPEDEREDLKDRVEDEYDIRPRIEPVNTVTPPDMVATVSKED